MFLKYTIEDYNYYEYAIKDDIISFKCGGIDEDEKTVAAMFDNFFLDMSKERKIFLYSYRLPEAYAVKLMDPSVIIEKAGILADPFQTFYHLSEAKIRSIYFQYASSVTIYYFENKVEWPNFLATSDIKKITGQEKKTELIKKGILSACFTSADQGADFWFECNKIHEKRVMQLLECMSNLGFKELPPGLI